MAKKNLFNSIKLTKPKKNVFDLSHDVKLSLNMGDLVPVMCMEAVPGDKFDISCESLLRFAPLVSPVMHRMDVTIHYFFVPNRILWPNWEKFITNTPADPLVPGVLNAFPTWPLNEPTYTELQDYLGLPKPGVTDTDDTPINAFPLAAYQCIYNEYYRDQNLIDPVNFTLVDGTNVANGDLYILRKRAWEHDYFTAALPFAQKGAAVDIPLGDVRIKDDWSTESGSATPPAFIGEDELGEAGALSQDLLAGGEFSGELGIQVAGGTDEAFAYDPRGTLETTPTTINDLRRAFRLQEWLEKAARGGSRYIENILSHFGVRSSDKRLQRPEYITGTKSPVVISEVLNTSDTATAPQGNMSGHGVSVTSGQYGSYYCEEHGYIIGIMSVMPKTAYQQGIPKHFLKIDDPFQYFWPSFAHIGEQEVLNKEIMFFGGTDPDDVFGYVPRYAEYKFENNRVAGEFRDSLDFWHLGRIFGSQPALNQAFVECVPRTDIFAVTGAQATKLYAHVLHKVKAVRPMPKFGVPSF